MSFQNILHFHHFSTFSISTLYILLMHAHPPQGPLSQSMMILPPESFE